MCRIAQLVKLRGNVDAGVQSAAASRGPAGSNLCFHSSTPDGPTQMPVNADVAEAATPIGRLPSGPWSAATSSRRPTLKSA